MKSYSKPLQLYYIEWAKENSAHFPYAKNEDILESGKKLAERFLTSRMIKGTSKMLK